MEINISDLQCGMLFRVKEDCTVKGFNLKKDTNLYVKKIYSRGDKVSFVVPAHLLENRSKKTLAVGAKYINLYFENKEVYRGKSLFDMVKLNEDVEIDIDEGESNIMNNKTIENKVEKSKNIGMTIPISDRDVKCAFVNGTTTVVILKTGEKGVAKCHKDDLYNVGYGYEIALIKARIKVEEKDIKSIDKNVKELIRKFENAKDEHNQKIEKLKTKLCVVYAFADTNTFNNSDIDKNEFMKRYSI